MRNHEPLGIGDSLIMRKVRTATFVGAVTSMALTANFAHSADGRVAARTAIGRKPAALSLINQSDLILTNLQISACGTGEWGPNQLDDMLLPGRMFTVTFIVPGCYNLRVSAPLIFTCVLVGAEIRGPSSWTITSWTTTAAALGDCSAILRADPAGAAPLR